MTASTPAPIPTTPPSVLVIDDEQGLRDVLAYGLPKRGFTVTCAPDGETALRLAQTTSFDLAVCDIMMSGMDGIRVLENLKKITPKTEVIMATGFATLETAVETMKKGAFDYVTKPYTVNNLCALLERALEHRRLKERVDHLEEVSRLKSEFIAVMSHELRTPITCTMGFISLLLEGVYGDVLPKQRDPLLRAVKSSENLLQLVNDILDFSKLSASRMTTSEDVFELRALAQEVVKVSESLAQSKGLTLTLDAPEPFWVRTDHTKLKQVFINILGNALKFTARGGATLRVRPGKDPLSVAIEVIDTGIGIRPEDFPKLFQEFTQLDSSVTRAHGGTGLGLCITKKMLELMKGTIGLESEFGKGTTVRIDLPVRIDQPAASVTAKSEPPAAAGRHASQRTILCIDDDPMMLRLLADNLQDTDSKVIGADGGQEGLALARQLHPDLITLDIMMPHMDGWSVLQSLKDDPELKDIPVYVVSIMDNKPLAFSLGVRDYLVKPFTREQLLSKLNIARRDRARHAFVVDDDPEVRKLVAGALEEDGYDVETIDSGEKAIQRLKQVRPELLLLDLVMEHVSGFDVLAALDSYPMPETMTIVMAEDRLTSEQSAFLERRVHAIVQKKSTLLADLVGQLHKRLPGATKAA